MKIRKLKVKKVASLKNDASLLDQPNSYGSRIKSLNAYQALEVLTSVNDYYLVKVDKNVGYVGKSDAVILSNICVAIKLSNQKMKIYHAGDIILIGKISSGGKKTPTPTGTYKIDYKSETATLVGDDYRVEVSYWMRFIKSRGIGMHSGNIKGKSHGCIRQTIDTARKSYEFCSVGDNVNIER